MELNWLTLPQMAVEASLKLFFKVLWRKKPEKIFRSIFDSNQNQIASIPEEDLEKSSKLAKKSWRFRVLCYSKMMPSFLYSIDPTSMLFKSSLKEWVKGNIPQHGDSIFRGKVEEKEDESDWLRLEVKRWRKRLDHEYHTFQEMRDVGEIQQ